MRINSEIVYNWLMEVADELDRTGDKSFAEFTRYLCEEAIEKWPFDREMSVDREMGARSQNRQVDPEMTFDFLIRK